MFCQNCGSRMEDSAQLCPACGGKNTNSESQSANEPIVTEYKDQQMTQNQYVPPYTQNLQEGATPNNAPIQDFLVWNIVLTVLSLCCNCLGLVTGIIGIVFSCGVRSAVTAGDITIAQNKAKTAKIMMIVTAVLVGLNLLYWGVLLFSGGIGAYMELMDEMMNYCASWAF